jgi:hypothetical protein
MLLSYSSYPDLCALAKRIVKYEPGQCPENLAQYGIDCECPVDVSKNDLDIEMIVSLPQAPEYVFYFVYLFYMFIYLFS